MKHLQRISIINARSFGEASIDIGQGATIILAPNGIGKTTIFESIEFALTGSIQRLENNLVPFIRDRQTEVNIRLEFEDRKYCEVKFQKNNKSLKLNGEHKFLFLDQNLTLNAVSYLLRLTHLLEQRNGRWFVQTSEENAGNLLDKISIGMHLNQMDSKMTSAKRQANKLKAEVNEKLNHAEKNLNDFIELIKNRNNVEINFKLRPVNEILLELNTIFKLVGGNVEETNAALSSIIGFSGQIRGKIHNQFSDYKEQTIQLASLETLLPEYNSNNVILQSKNKIQHDFEAKKFQLEKDLNIQKNQQNQKTLQIQKIESEIKNLKDNQQLLLILDFDGARKSQFQKELKEKQKDLSELQDIYKNKIRELEKVNSIIDLRSSFNKQVEELVRFKGKIASLEELLKAWLKQNDKLIKLEKEIIPNLKKDQESIAKNLNDTSVKFENYEQEYKAILRKFTTLNNASDAIHHAVSIIATHLPEERGDCPVCGQVYNPTELKIRITNALNTIDPLRTKVVEEKKEITEKYEKFKSDLDRLRTNFTQIDVKLKDAQEEYRKIKANIDEQICPKFSQADTIEKAITWLSTQNEELVKTQQQLDEKAGHLPDEPKSETLINLESNKRTIQRQISEITEQIQTFHINIKKLDETLKNIHDKIGDLDSDLIKTEIRVKEDNLGFLQKEIDEIKIENENSFKQLEAIIEQIDIIFSENSKTAERQSMIKTLWSNLKLQNEPSIFELSKEKQVIMQKINSLNEIQTQFNELSEELERWKTVERFDDLDKRIKEICGGKTEEEYLKDLEHKKEYCDRRVKNIDDKTKLLNSLYSNIDKELKSAQEMQKLINPLWQRLLKRVVIDPRFEKVHLDNYFSYNKPKAVIRIPLSNESVNVDKIASEAQITDLQLTFMLAIANVHKWTHWKALLLDDPTQHHDLVHASAVFDLLRDYIADFDYQILLSTHDSTQARFFLRKLQNDGLPARIWKLMPSENGVEAKRFE